MHRATANGGFPLPPPGQPARTVATRHDACGAETRVRLPQPVPPRAVRRVVCERCAQPYEAHEVEERGMEPRSRFERLPPADSRIWRLAGIPLAALAVIAILFALRGSEEQPGGGREAAPPGEMPATSDVLDGGKRGEAARLVPGGGAATIISQSTFSLALPAGWERVSPTGGATFAAAGPAGEADASLWVERDPKLSFTEFEARSLEQVKQLAGGARIVDRVLGPTPEASSSRIVADAPQGAPGYEVALRANGPYRYYLAITTQPDASSETLDGIEVILGSFTPEGGRRP